MAQFIHLTDNRQVRQIRRNGIKVSKLASGKGSGIFATPVLPNYYLSHQWVRELKRNGAKTIAAVQFRIDDDTPVLVGRYNEEHIESTAAGAVRIFMEHATGLGLEVLLSHPVPPEVITRIYTPSQISGWRYYPESHADGRKPCGCSYCQRGQIKSRKLREAYGWD